MFPRGPTPGVPRSSDSPSSARPSGHRREHRMNPLAVNQRLELRTEFLDSRNDRNRAGITQHADRCSCHEVSEIEQRVEIFHRALTVTNTLEDFRSPCSAFPALRALGA